MNIRIILLSVAIWTVLLGASLAWSIIDKKQHALELAKIAARENFNKDQAFRLWGSKHGGVYVPPTEHTPPNPALAHLPYRDVVTKNGMKLTLMNPAYMLRQMMNEYAELYGVRAKITGRVLLNPINAPDDWELEALNGLESGIKEVSQQASIDGKSYLRFMRPMYMKESCLLCHGHLGFKVGDLRGGVSVAIPLEQYFQSASTEIVVSSIAHSIIWLLGIVSLISIRNSLHQRSLEYKKTESLRQEVLHAEAASLEKSKFLSRMSHELRTPLNAILGFGQILALNPKQLNHTQRGNVQEILDAGNHLLTLINDVLDLTKIETGNMEFSIERVALDEVLQQSIALLTHQADARNIKFIDNISGKNHHVSADFIRLKQAILNLLSNAVKYNREHGTISLDSKQLQNKRLRITVTDTGHGLNNSDIDKLFNSFERLDPINNVEGTGIGLVITKNFIEGMNGKIGVESTLDKGSSFWIELDECPSNSN